MNKSMYFLIPAIIGVIALIGYSTISTDKDAHNDGHTMEDHAALEPATTVHDDSGEAAHAHE